MLPRAAHMRHAHDVAANISERCDVLCRGAREMPPRAMRVMMRARFTRVYDADAEVLRAARCVRARDMPQRAYALHLSALWHARMRVRAFFSCQELPDKHITEHCSYRIP